MLAAVIVVGLVSVGAPRARAQDPARLGEGDWQATLSIDGVATGTIEGAPYQFTVDLDGSFELSVVNETVGKEENIGVEAVNGTIDGGSWQVTGDAEFFAIIPGQGDGTVSWDLEVANGTAAGSASEPVLAGNALSTNGTLTSSLGTTSVAIPNSTDPIEFNLRVTASDCHEVHGTVDLELIESSLQAQGASTAFEGSWFAHVDQESTQLTLDQWTEQMKASEIFELDTTADGLPGVARMASALINAYNDWAHDLAAGAGGRPFAHRTINLINDAALFLNRLRNLTECEAAIYSDDVLTSFETLGKQRLLQLGRELADTDELPPSKLWLLHTIAVNAGAIGATAPQPAGAEFHEALRGRVERILDNVVITPSEGVSETTIPLVPATRTTLAFGAQMDFYVELAGTTHSVRELWNEAQAKEAAVAAEAAANTETTANAAEGE